MCWLRTPEKRDSNYWEWRVAPQSETATGERKKKQTAVRRVQRTRSEIAASTVWTLIGAATAAVAWRTRTLTHGDFRTRGNEETSAKIPNHPAKSTHTWHDLYQSGLRTGGTAKLNLHGLSLATEMSYKIRYVEVERSLASRCTPGGGQSSVATPFFLHDTRKWPEYCLRGAGDQYQWPERRDLWIQEASVWIQYSFLSNLLPS